MRVIADQMRALLPSNLENPSNSLRSNFVEELAYAATIEAIPLPTIPVFPKKCRAAREAFKDWSWE